MSNRKERNGGFTLIELLVVIAIIGIVVGVAVGQYRHSIQRAKEAVLKEDLYIMRVSINQYFADKGNYPMDLETLVEESYLSKVPVDPITGSADTWQTRLNESSDMDISTETGIVDVFSGAEGAFPDGTSYAEW